MLKKLKNFLDPPLDKKIFFLHIAKCGGMSIRDAIINCYKLWRSVEQNTIIYFDENAARFAENHTIGTGNCVRIDLSNYMMHLPKVKCLVGHYGYSQAAFEQFADQWHFITLLRDPVERWFSQYSFNKNTNYPKFNISLELEDFVETDSAASLGRLYVNIMTPDLSKDNSLNQRIEIATERLKKFSLVGALENLKQFKKEFRQIFSYEIHIKHLNKASKSKRKQRNEISSEVYARVNEICKPDMQVYKNVIGKSG